ncbi:hypothetical protein PMAYCL1PPCAC_23843, partial [Pristionchus mayeri]
SLPPPFILPHSPSLYASVFYSRQRMKGLFLLLCLRSLAEGAYVEEDGLTFDNHNSHPRLVSGEWSECSVSCGNGVQSRSVECLVSHPLAGHLKLPIDECRNEMSRPLFRPCSLQRCALNEEGKGEDFHWKHSQWSPCSASCLGGKQRALLQCIQLSSGRPVAWSNCDGRRRPPEKTRGCNGRPCPPDWVVSSWSPCQKECGATRTRSVSCLSITTNVGGARGSTKRNETECTGERPPSTQLCPNRECAGWKIGDWSECSVSCGVGEERRSVDCSLDEECPSPPPEKIRKCER